MKGARALRANLMQAIFESADLTGADLRGANLYQCETWRAKTAEVSLDAAFTKKSKLERR
jgi:uncharacterized protein YjbI with pentapeptide repeats